MYDEMRLRSSVYVFERQVVQEQRAPSFLLLLAHPLRPTLLLVPLVCKFSSPIDHLS